MKNKIVLNWCPPATIDMPSPSMSVLKTYLERFNFNVEIKYWNIAIWKLQREFVFEVQCANEMLSLLLFYNYLAIKYDDKEALCRVKANLMSVKPQYLNLPNDFFDKHMLAYADKLHDVIIQELNNINLENVLFIGFTANLYQWIPSSIIAEIIKEKYNIPIVVGGIGTRGSALSILNNFHCFDISTWGEGENILLKISIFLQKNDTTNDNMLLIPNIAIRKSTGVAVSSKINHDFTNLSDSLNSPNFQDYFKQLSEYCILNENIALTIEGGRGCHWKKCNFCYLNMGYKYRTKAVLTIIKEITYSIKNYNIKKFTFLDNDLIANDIERFDSLLDSLISIKKKFPSFQIEMAEIITKGVNAKTIKKMSLAGFRHVQIGYESASDDLLKKISKKNSFGSNLFFIIQAIKYGISIEGANIIKGLFGETEDNILESIENLRYLRFVLSNDKFSHSYSTLTISHSSKNFQILKDSPKFITSHILYYLPKGFILPDELEECFFTERFLWVESPLWSHFELVERYFRSSLYTYRLIEYKNQIVYTELLNNETINILEFDKGSLDCLILKTINNKNISILELKEVLNEYSLEEIQTTLKALNEEKLIYVNSDFSEIVPIIDFEQMN